MKKWKVLYKDISDLYSEKKEMIVEAEDKNDAIHKIQKSLDGTTNCYYPSSIEEI